MEVGPPQPPCRRRLQTATRSRLIPGVNDSGRRFFSITTKISRRDPRPCPHEYHPPIVYTPRSTRCSPPLTTRDVEAALVDALGEQASVSRSTVSRICAQIKTEFEAWSRRPLDDLTLDYLFLDASHFRYHANAAAEPVLAGWGIDTDGQPVFVGLGTAASESG